MGIYDFGRSIDSIYIGRFYPKDEVGKNEGAVRVSFRDRDRLQETRSDSGIYEIIDGEDFVECVKTVDGEVVLQYRVPKKINRDEILGKLVPADLRDYPYEAQAEADTAWKHTDLLRAFGIERIT